jgi:hypothetical protein
MGAEWGAVAVSLFGAALRVPTAFGIGDGSALKVTKRHSLLVLVMDLR